MAVGESEIDFVFQMDQMNAGMVTWSPDGQQLAVLTRYLRLVSSLDKKVKSFHDLCSIISKTFCCQGSGGKRKAPAMEAGSCQVFR